MFKFLRKYSKALLVFFGVFLMVAFLMPTALQEVMRRQSLSATALTIDGQKFSGEDMIDAERQLRTVESLTFGVFPTGLGVSDRGDHWVLAREAARRGGFYGGAADGSQVIRESAEVAVASRFGPQGLMFLRSSPELQQQATTLAQQQIEAREVIGARVGLDARGVDLALSAARGVARYQQAFVTAPRVGLNRVVRAARQRLDTAEMQVLFVGVDPNVAAMPDPTEDELKAHFEKYRDKRAGQDGAAFGYRQPNRFRFESITLDRTAIEKAVRVSPVEIQKRLLDGASSEVTDPVQRRAAVEAAIRRESAEKALAEATLAYKAEVLSMVRTLGEKDGYKVVTPEWAAKRPGLAQVAAKMVERVLSTTGVAMPEPVVTSRTDAPVTQDELMKLDLWSTAARRSNVLAPFGQLLGDLKELRTAESPKAEFVIQAGVPYAEPLETRAGGRVFVMITEAMPSAPAGSLDEVRSQVINDAKKARAAAQLAEQAGAFETVAGAQGLDELAEQLRARGGVTTDLRTGVRVGSTFVSPADSPANDQAFRDAAVKRMASIDPTLPLEKAPPTDLVIAVPLPTKLGVAVAKFTSFTPATMERFRTVAGNLMLSEGANLIEDRSELLAEPRLAKRLKVAGRAGQSEPDANDKDGKAPRGPAGFDDR